MNKKLISLAAAAVMVLSVPFNAYAHSGRTDSSGGHKDNKNVSGLGYYHYHCDGLMCYNKVVTPSPKVL